MAGAHLSFDLRDLLAAAVDSRLFLSAVLSDLFEGAPVSVELGLLSAQGLPALDDDVGVLGIKLDFAADTLGYFGGRERGPASQEGIVNQLAALGVVQYRAPHEIHRLLRRVIVLRLVTAAHDELRRG